MRITYQRAVRYGDETVYSVVARHNAIGEPQLGPRQRQKLLTCGAWRLRAGSLDGPDVHIADDGTVMVER